MANEEALYKELGFIQNVVDRQARNSFLIKGWTVTLVVAALVFRTNDAQFFVAVIPLLSFWGLDAYFLRQERLFRALYAQARGRGDDDGERFSLDTSSVNDEVHSVFRVMFSKTLLVFYGSISTLLLVYAILVFQMPGGPCLA